MKDLSTEWLTEVDELRALLDESISEHLPVASSSFHKVGVAWGRIGVSKFCDRVLPYLHGAGTGTRAAISEVNQAVEDAVSFGNSTLIVGLDGRVRVSVPEKGFAEKNSFGEVTFNEVIGDRVKTVGIDSHLYMIRFDEADQPLTPELVGYCFSIFYKADGAHKRGQSRISPAIRSMIRAEARSNIRVEESENFTSNPQKIINGIWEELDQGTAENIQRLAAGVSRIIGLPKDPETGEKLSIEEFSSSSFEGLLKSKESRARQCASALNIDPSELGILTANPSSAEAFYQTKEDLVLEVERFTASIRGELQAFFAAVADAYDEPVPELRFRSPSTPSANQTSDAFVKLASVIPALKYSRTGLTLAGLTPEIIQDLIDEGLLTLPPVGGEE